MTEESKELLVLFGMACLKSILMMAVALVHNL